MTKETNDRGSEIGLWRRARVAWRGAVAPAEAPDPLMLAAYLDGTLDPQARERVEAWMAGSSDALDLAIAAREAQAVAPAPAPDRVARRAQGLVAGRRAAPAGVRGWLDGLFTQFGAVGRPAAWAAVAALFLLVWASGFELGRMGAMPIPVQVTMGDDLGFGLSDSSDEFL